MMSDLAVEVGILNTLTARVPITGWLFSYHKNLASNLKADILAAITVGFMLIPQSMAYALLAGLPPIYGLYAALMPLIIYTVRYEKLPTFFVLAFLLPPPPKFRFLEPHLNSLLALWQWCHC